MPYAARLAVGADGPRRRESGLPVDRERVLRSHTLGFVGREAGPAVDGPLISDCPHRQRHGGGILTTRPSTSIGASVGVLTGGHRLLQQLDSTSMPT